MLAKREKADEFAKAAADAARQAKVEFHEAVLLKKKSVREQFGPNSDKVQAIGYKRKSKYKRPRRRLVT